MDTKELIKYLSRFFLSIVSKLDALKTSVDSTKDSVESSSFTATYNGEILNAATEANFDTNEGNKLRTGNIEIEDLLGMVVKELKAINLQLSFITENQIIN